MSTYDIDPILKTDPIPSLAWMLDRRQYAIGLARADINHLRACLQRIMDAAGRADVMLGEFPAEDGLAKAVQSEVQTVKAILAVTFGLETIDV